MNRNSIDIQSIAVRLTRRASITGTPEEISFPDHLLAVLKEIPFYAKHPEQLFDIPLQCDEKGRRIVLAFAPGQGSSCIVLSGHYDVVDIEDYGTLEPFAFDPDMLARKMLQQLTTKASLSPLSPAETLLKSDLESGAFIPGRGMLDMKSGLAAGIGVLSEFLEDTERMGNLIFVAVPDEEGCSVGIKGAKGVLKEFAASHGLEPRAVINLDATVDRGEGADGKAVFLGSVSKMLPFVLFVGKPAHAGSPFDGFNPVLPASIFAKEVECNSDSVNTRSPFPGEEPPPPTTLYYREMRDRYDVTMPSDVFCALNVLTYEKVHRKYSNNFAILPRRCSIPRFPYSMSVCQFILVSKLHLLQRRESTPK